MDHRYPVFTVGCIVLPTLLAVCGCTQHVQHPQNEPERQQAMWREWLDVLDDPNHPRHRDAPRMLTSPVLFPYVTDRSTAVRPLIRHLCDEGPAFRASAATALGRIGDNRAARPLLRALADPAPQVRAAACEALAALRRYDPNTRGRIADLLLKDEHADVRRSAAEALGTLGAPATVGPTLVAMLDDERDAIRMAAAKGLGGTWDYPPAVAALAKASRDPEAGVRMTALTALGQLRGKHVGGRLPAVMAALDDGAAKVREAAIAAVAKFGDEAVDPLVAHVRDERPLHPTPRVRALAAIEGKTATTTLVTLTRAEQDQAVRLAALRALAYRAERAVDARPALTALLEDEDEAIRRAAADALGCIGAAGHSTHDELAAAVDRLLDRLAKDEDADVRVASVTALGAIARQVLLHDMLIRAPHLGPNPLLVSISKGVMAAVADRSAAVRLAAIEAIEMGGVSVSTPPLEQPLSIEPLLEDEDEAVRVAAVRLIARRGFPYVWRAAFEKALSHSDAAVRAAMVYECGRLGRRVGVLDRAADPDEVPAVRIAAMRGLAEGYAAHVAPGVIQRSAEERQEVRDALLAIWRDTANPLAIRVAALCATEGMLIPPIPARRGVSPTSEVNARIPTDGHPWASRGTMGGAFAGTLGPMERGRWTWGHFARRFMSSIRWPSGSRIQAWMLPSLPVRGPDSGAMPCLASPARVASMSSTSRQRCRYPARPAGGSSAGP